MYQSYPTGGGPEQVQTGPPEPQSVANAVKLMYAGAVISAIEIVVSLTTIGSVKSAIKKAYPHYTPTQVHDLEVSGIALVVVTGLIGVALWFVMARLNRQAATGLASWLRCYSASTPSNWCHSSHARTRYSACSSRSCYGLSVSARSCCSGAANRRPTSSRDSRDSRVSRGSPDSRASCPPVPLPGRTARSGVPALQQQGGEHKQHQRPQAKDAEALPS